MTCFRNDHHLENGHGSQQKQDSLKFLQCVSNSPRFLFIRKNAPSYLSQPLSFNGGSPPSPCETSSSNGFSVEIPGGWRCQVSKLIIPNLERSPQEGIPRWWQLKYLFIVHPENWERWTQFDEDIFQMGWFNHQLGTFWNTYYFRRSIACHPPKKRFTWLRKMDWTMRNSRKSWNCWCFRNPKQPPGII